MSILTLETTCDETAAAVIDENLQVLASIVASQDHLHQRFGGVVPEMASRAHLERLLPVVDETLRKANVSLSDLQAIAVANTPGLAGSLLVGVAGAKALALALGIPLIGIDHLQAHIYACRMAYGPEVFPCVGLIVSGGHSNLYRCSNPLDFTLLGGTIDDAAGEAFDKVATLLGLPYPGGPSIAKAAERGNPRAFRLPRSFIQETDKLQFSFSGLKTAVRYQLYPQSDTTAPEQTDQFKADLAASFQQAVVEVLVTKSLAAARLTKLSSLCVGGGVAANVALRTELKAACEQEGIRLFVAPPELCTDNAVMGAIAWEKYRAGNVDSLALDVLAGLVRQPRNKKKARKT